MPEDFPSFDLRGRVALVTASARGLGRACALALAHAGADVALGLRRRESGKSLASEIASMGRRALPLQMDMESLDEIRAAIEEAHRHFGRIDILVNNAGVSPESPAIDVPEADFDYMVRVNLKGTFFASQAVGRLMIAQRYGRIVNMSSQAGSVGIRDHAVYCATKGGVEQFTRVLALEWGHRGVTVNAVAPTFIRTPGTAERLDQPDYLKSVLDRIPIGRVGTIDDVAGAVIYLASPAGGMVNGEVLKVDGGWTAQ